MKAEKIKILDTINGFTERDQFSKAVLNTDIDSLLKYKIQKRKSIDSNKIIENVSSMQNEINSLKDDLHEIKKLLQLITNKN